MTEVFWKRLCDTLDSSDRFQALAEEDVAALARCRAPNLAPLPRVCCEFHIERTTHETSIFNTQAC
ncbi:MAG: hypothetical protein HQ559_14885 [Lentisphaerae bacterium]|nr:hypothetical protein [Lentisphaerota bacterium]